MIDVGYVIITYDDKFGFYDGENYILFNDFSV